MVVKLWLELMLVMVSISSPFLDHYLNQNILSITETSNVHVGDPGVWMFEVSTGTYMMLSNSMVVLFSRVPPKVMDANKIATSKNHNNAMITLQNSLTAFKQENGQVKTMYFVPSSLPHCLTTGTRLETK